MLPKELGALPKSSCLLVTVKDVSITEGPSYILASDYIDMSGEYVNQTIEYTLRSPKPPKVYSDRAYSVSAVLNLGWCKRTSPTGEWIKKGDYLSVKKHLIQFDYKQDEYETNIDLICYGK